MNGAVAHQPYTDYQRWELSAAAEYVQVGEDIQWLPREVARDIGIPFGYDWWLLDDRQLIIMEFNAADEVVKRTLVTHPGEVARHRAWRDLAVSHAHLAGRIAAACGLRPLTPEQPMNYWLCVIRAKSSTSDGKSSSRTARPSRETTTSYTARRPGSAAAKC